MANRTGRHNMIPLKKYFWYLVGTLGVVFFWIGVWDGIGSLVESPWLSIGIGIVLLLLYQPLFRGENPLLKLGEDVQKVFHTIHQHPQKHQFHICYLDKVRKIEVKLHARNLKRIEKNFLVFAEKGGELFLPAHRVTRILHHDKLHWRAHG